MSVKRIVGRIALYLAIYTVGFGLLELTLTPIDIKLAAMMILILGIGIGTADAVIGLGDSITELGRAIISRAYRLVGFIAAATVAYALLSSVLWGYELTAVDTWASAFAYIIIVTSPLLANALLMRCGSDADN